MTDTKKNKKQKREMSMRSMITLWFGIIMVLEFGITLLFVYFLGNAGSVNDPEGFLIKAVTRNANQFDLDDDGIDWDEVSMYKDGVYFSYYDAQGNLLRGSFPEGSAVAEDFHSSQITTVQINNVLYYVYDLPTATYAGTFWVRGILSSQSRSDVKSSVTSTIVTLTWSLFPVLILVALIGGWLIANAALKPLDKIMDKVDSISGGDDLSARIESGTGAREIKRLEKTFNQMFERLETSFNAERQFSSDVSHELRTPIAIIQAECEHAMLKAKAPEDYQEALESIKEQSEKMAQLASDLLDTTRLQQGTDRYPLQNANLSTFIEACCDEFIPEEDRGIQMKLDIEQNVNACFNPTLTSRILINLLQNAYRYGNEHGNVSVRLKRREDMAVLEVADDGIGIAKEDQEKIWQRFWQGHNPEGKIGGTGLGLSMVKEMAEVQNGRVSVTSELGSGSTFTVWIPLSS
jgi:signal transduction histidine kinase